MKLRSCLTSGYPYLYCCTQEEDRAIKTFVMESSGFTCFAWDCVSGLTNLMSGATQPQLTGVMNMLKSVATLPDNSVLFLKDFHRYFDTVPENVRMLRNLKRDLEARGVHIFFISPVLKIPKELEKDITVVDLPLPTLSELMEIASWAKKNFEENNPNISIPDPDENSIRNAVGLTSNEARNVLSRCLSETQKFDRAIIEEEKLQAVKKSGLVDKIDPVPLDQVGGLSNIVDYVMKRVIGFNDTTKPTPRGILGVGLPGSGKSLFAKVVGSILGMYIFSLNVSSLKASHVGESEANLRAVLKLFDAIGRCIIYIDEIDKMLEGAISSARTDGGTTASMVGYLLTWMQESKGQHYIVATCNDIGKLMEISQGALLRSGRFDAIFFFDLPTKNERVSILHIMNKRYGTNHPDSIVDNMQNWTGAEIEAFVKDSIYEGTEVALRNIHPIFDQNREIIERARQWAQFNARPANSPNGEAEKRERRVKSL